jgi:uncharacterized protein (TIGR02246 family)
MLEQVTWRHVGYAVLGAGVGGILGAMLLLAMLPALPAAEILEIVRSVEIFDPAEPAIRSLEQEWVDAINAGDVDRVVALFDPEATIQPPTGASIVGHEAIRDFTEAFLARAELKLETVVDRVLSAAANDLAYSQGTYRIGWTTAAGEPAEAQGSFAVVWGKREGEWRVLVDSFNAVPSIETGGMIEAAE